MIGAIRTSILSRRGFLGALGKLGVGMPLASLASCGGRENSATLPPTIAKRTEANDWFHRFPEFPISRCLAGKHEEPGAKYLMVNIRMRHEGDEDTSPEEDDKTIKVQQSVKLILETLMANQFPKRIYLDGTTPDSAKNLMNTRAGIRDYTQLLRDVDTALEMVNEKVKAGQASPQLREEQRKLLEHRVALKAKLSNNTELNRSMQMDAVVQLFIEGKITILGGETKELINETERALEIYKQTHDARPVDETSEKRENHLLSVVAAAPFPVAVTVYGRDDDFRNNINAWNTQHPDRKISFIDVIPAEFVPPEKLKALEKQLEEIREKSKLR